MPLIKVIRKKPPIRMPDDDYCHAYLLESGKVRLVFRAKGDWATITQTPEYALALSRELRSITHVRWHARFRIWCGARWRKLRKSWK